MKIKYVFNTLPDSETDFIRDKILVNLIPALEETLNKAKIWEALRIQKCFFNGIDHIVQVVAYLMANTVSIQ